MRLSGSPHLSSQTPACVYTITVVTILFLLNFEMSDSPEQNMLVVTWVPQDRLKVY